MWNYNRLFDYAKEHDKLRHAIDSVLPEILKHLDIPEGKFYSKWIIDIAIPIRNPKWTYIRIHNKDATEWLSILTEDLAKILQAHGVTATQQSPKLHDQGANPCEPASLTDNEVLRMAEGTWRPGYYVDPSWRK